MLNYRGFRGEDDMSCTLTPGNERVSSNRCVAAEGYALMAPLVPEGTIAILLVIAPSKEESVPTSG